MMDQTRKDDAARRLGRALVYIISLAHEDQAADAERVSEAPSASATGGTLDDKEPRERFRRSVLSPAWCISCRMASSMRMRQATP